MKVTLTGMNANYNGDNLISSVTTHAFDIPKTYDAVVSGSCILHADSKAIASIDL